MARKISVVNSSPKKLNDVFFSNEISSEYVKKQNKIKSEVDNLLSVTGEIDIGDDTLSIVDGKLGFNDNRLAIKLGYASEVERKSYKKNNSILYEPMGGIKYISSDSADDNKHAKDLSDAAVNKMINRHKNTDIDEMDLIIKIVNSGEWQDKDTMKKYSDKIKRYVNDYIALDQIGYFDGLPKDKRKNNIESLKSLKDYADNQSKVFAGYGDADSYNFFKDIIVLPREEQLEIVRGYYNAYNSYKRINDDIVAYRKMLEGTGSDENIEEYKNYLVDWYNKNKTFNGARESYGISKGYVLSNGSYDKSEENSSLLLDQAERLAAIEVKYGNEDNVRRRHEMLQEYWENINTSEEFREYNQEMLDDPNASQYIEKGKKIYKDKNPNVTDEERKVAYYYLGKGEKKNYYFTWLEDVVYKREVAASGGWSAVTDGETLKYHRLWSDYTKDAPLEANALSVALNLGAGAEFAYNTLNGDIKESKLSKAGSKIREAQSNKHYWEGPLGVDLYDFVYNTAMSGVDSLVAGSVGSGGSIALGLSAAAAGVNDAFDRGMSDFEALCNGLANGINEYIFEKFSLGNLEKLKASKGAGLKTFINNLCKEMLVNASEEAATEFANMVYDIVFNGDLSNYALSVRRYMENGLSENEAKKRVGGDLGLQIVEAAASGGLMGVGFGVIGNTSASINAARYGKFYYGYLQKSVYALAQNGLAMPENSAAHKQAVKVENLLKSGKNVSGAQLYNLAIAIESEIETKSKARLAELGMDKNKIKEIAPIVAKMVFGEKITSNEYNAVNENEIAVKVAKELSEDKANTVWRDAMRNSRIKDAGKLDSNIFANYNTNAKNYNSDTIYSNNQFIEEGGKYGSKNPELLGRGAISTDDRGNDVFGESGANSSKIATRLGIPKGLHERFGSKIWQGKSDWLRGKYYPEGKTGKRFKQGVFGKIRRVKLSGRDTTGGIVSRKILDDFKDTICKDENGNLILLYHWTSEKFSEFTKGQFGFHFGTVRAAYDRYLQAKKEDSNIEEGVLKEVILNVRNPIELSDEDLQWTAGWVAFQLMQMGAISELEYNVLSSIDGFYENTYNNPAAIAVRDVLSQKGYDGIIYENLCEDVGSYSIIALYPEQIITVAENGVLLENSGISRAISRDEGAFLKEYIDNSFGIDKIIENDGVADSNKDFKYNDDFIEEGGKYGSKNPELLEREAISTDDRGNDLLWQQGSNSEAFKLGMEVSEGANAALRYTSWSGRSGWFDERKNTTSEKTRKRFEESVYRRIRGIKLSGKDTVGRTVSSEILDKFKDTVCKDENGNLILLYHWTSEKFSEFTKGEFGFHFGTLKAAYDRYLQSKDENLNVYKGIYKEVILNIKNPIELVDEANEWNAHWISLQLLEKGIITKNIYNNLSNIDGFYENTYNNPAAIAVRDVLSQKGYDGIVYENLCEDVGSYSIIALYPEQIVTVFEENVNNEKTNDSNLASSGKYSLDSQIQQEKISKYWYPNMSKAEIDLVRRIAKRELKTTDNYIDNENKWLYNRTGDKIFFALYSTSYVDEPTVLYACKNDRAEYEYWYFINKWIEKEGKDNGQLYSKSEYVDRLFKISENIDGKGIVNNRYIVGRGSDTGDAGIYSKNSRRRPSEALLNCLRNIEKVQGDVGRVLGRGIESDKYSISTNQLAGLSEPNIEDIEISDETQFSNDHNSNVKYISYEENTIDTGENKNEFSQKYIDELLDSFGITKLGDYIHVQKCVVETIEREGYFKDKEKRCTKVVNDATGMVIEINKSGIRETFNLDNFARLGKFKKLAKLSVVRYLPRIVRYADLIIDNIIDEHNGNNNKKFAYFKTDIYVEQIPITVKLSVKKSQSKNKLWVHSIYTKKDAIDSPVSTISAKTSHIIDNTNKIDDQNVISKKGYGTFNRIVEDYSSNNPSDNVEKIKSDNKVSANEILTYNYLNVNKLQMHTVDICKKLDSSLTVEFVDGLDVNGKYIRSENKILIRSDLSAVQMYVEVFKHKFMHRLETKSLYNKFFNYCFNDSKAFEQYVRAELKFINTNEDIELMTRESVFNFYAEYKYNQYKNSKHISKNDRDAFTIENAKEEIIADFFAQILFQGEQYRNRIIEALDKADGEMLAGIGDEISSEAALLELREKEPALLEQVIEWIKDIINHLRDWAQGKTILNDLENELKYLEHMLTRVYRSKDSRKFEKQKLNEEKHLIGGEKSQTADRSLLFEAKLRLYKGEDNEVIRKDTGWYKGRDGKWRYYIPDNELNIDRLLEFANSGDEAVLLGDVITHNKLFAAYPELESVRVEFKNLDNNDLGKYIPNKNIIFLNYKLFNNIEMLTDTLIHEVQHILQVIEDFACGGNEKTGFYYAINTAYDMVSRSEQFNSLETKEKRFDYLCNIALKLFDAKNLGELAYKSYLKFYGEVEARQVAQYREYDETLLKLVEPDVSGNVVSFKVEKNKYFAILKLLGYNNNEIESFQKQAGVINDESESGNIYSRDDTLLLQAGKYNIRGTNKYSVDKEENFSIGGNRDGYRSHYRLSDSGTAITDEEGEKSGKFLGTGVRIGISAHERQLAQRMENALTADINGQGNISRVQRNENNFRENVGSRSNKKINFDTLGYLGRAITNEKEALLNEEIASFDYEKKYKLTNPDISQIEISAETQFINGLSGEKLNKLQMHTVDICKRLDGSLTVEFVDGLDVNGKYIRSENKMLIKSDLNAVQMYVEVLKHEFMHRLETKSLYNKFFNYCFNDSKAFEQYVRAELKLINTSEDTELMTRESVFNFYAEYKYNQYKNSKHISKNDRDAFTIENAKEEIIADFFAQILFQGEQYRNRIIEALDKADGEMLAGIGDEISSEAALLELREKEPALLEQVIEWIKDIINRLRDWAQGKTILNDLENEIHYLERMLTRVYRSKDSKWVQNDKTGEVKYNLTFDEAVEKLNANTFDKNNNTHVLLLENTPSIYIEKAGSKNLKIIASWDVIYLALHKSGNVQGNYHGLGVEAMKKIPEALKDPLYIVKQGNGRVIAITEIVVKGNRSAIVSLEFDTFKSTVQDGENKSEDYNLIVTFIDAKANYLQNTIFAGEIVYNKNNESPTNFILRLKSLKKALPNDDLAELSNNSIYKLNKMVKYKNERIALYYAINTAYDMVNRSNEFNCLETKEEKFDYLCKIALNLFNAKSIEELVYKAYLNIYGEVEARQSEKYRKYDENLLKLVKPDANGNVINNLEEINKFFATLVGLGYNKEVVNKFIAGDEKNNVQQRSSSGNDRGDNIYLQQISDNFRDVDNTFGENFGYKGRDGNVFEESSGIHGDWRTKGRTSYGRSVERVKSAYKENEIPSGNLGTGVRNAIPTQEKYVLARVLNEKLVSRNTYIYYAFNMAYDMVSRSEQFNSLETKEERFDYLCNIALKLFDAKNLGELAYKSYLKFYGEVLFDLPLKYKNGKYSLNISKYLSEINNSSDTPSGKNSLGLPLQQLKNNPEAYSKYLNRKYNSQDIKKAAIKSGGAKYSIKQTSRIQYLSQLNMIEHGEMNGSNSLYLGIPSRELQDRGFSNFPFAMNQSDYRKSRITWAKNKNYSSHSVPYSFFENMPQYIADSPLLIDNNEKVTIITNFAMNDTKGNNSFVIAGALRNQIMESDIVNLIKSVYPLDDFVVRITKAAENGKLVVVNKNKAEQMLATIGIQPAEVSRIISLAKSNITQNTEIVNNDDALLQKGEANNLIDFEFTEPTTKDIVRTPTESEAIEEAITGKRKTSIQRYIVDLCKKLDGSLTVEFVDGLDVNGKYIRSENKMLIKSDLSAVQMYVEVFKHEFMHRLETKSLYNKFFNYCFNDSKAFEQYVRAELKLINTSEDTELMTREIVFNFYAEYKYNQYKNSKHISKNDRDAFTIENAKEEIIADFFAQILFQGEQYRNRIIEALDKADGEMLAGIGDEISSEAALLELREKEPALLEQVIEWIKDIINRLRDWAQGKTLLNDLENELKYLERMVMRVYQSKDSKQLVWENQNNIKYSIKKSTNGQYYVEVENNIIVEKNDGKAIAKILSDIVKIKFKDFINVSGQKIGLNGKSVREWQYSKDAQYLLTNSKQAYIDKLNAFNNADELLIIAKNYVGEAIKHERKDNFVEFARGTVDFKVSNRGYSADIIVGTTKSNVMLLYDIVGLQKKVIEEASHTAQDRRAETTSINNIISTNNEFVNNEHSNRLMRKKQMVVKFSFGVTQDDIDDYVDSKQENHDISSDLYIKDLTEPNIEDIEISDETRFINGLSGEKLNKLQMHIVDICKRLDSSLTVEFVDGLDVNGKYIRSENKILIKSDLNAVQMYVEVFKHEFMNLLKTKQLYARFLNYCFNDNNGQKNTFPKGDATQHARENINIDIYGHNADNISRANEQGEFINEYYYALNKSEWKTFYNKITNKGYLATANVGVVAPIVVNDKLIIAERLYAGKDAHDYVVVDAYKLLAEEGDTYTLSLIQDALSKGEIDYDTQRIFTFVNRLNRLDGRNELLARYNRDNSRFDVAFANGKQERNIDEIHGDSKKEIARERFSLRDKSSVQEYNEILNRSYRESFGSALTEAQESKSQEDNGILDNIYQACSIAFEQYVRAKMKQLDIDEDIHFMTRESVFNFYTEYKYNQYKNSKHISKKDRDAFTIENAKEEIIADFFTQILFQGEQYRNIIIEALDKADGEMLAGIGDEISSEAALLELGEKEPELLKSIIGWIKDVKNKLSGLSQIKILTNDLEYIRNLLMKVYNLRRSKLFSNINSENSHTKITRQEMRRVVNVCKKLGYNVVFEDLREMVYKGEILSPDGYIENDIIHINIYAVNPVEFVFKHELTHFCEDSSGYEEFAKVVKESQEYAQWIKSKTQKDNLLDAEEKYKQMIYESYNIFEPLTDKKIDCEIISDFVGENLFTNNGSGLLSLVDELEPQKRNIVVQWVLDFIAYLKRLLGVYESNSNLQLSVLEESYRCLLNDAINEKRNAKGIQNTDDIQFCFIRCTDNEVINDAENMEKTGAKQQDIWKKLKVIRDAYGNWLSELSIEKYKFFAKGNATIERGSVNPNIQLDSDIIQGKLSDFVRFKLLFNLYPKLKNVDVVIKYANTNYDTAKYLIDSNKLIINKYLYDRYVNQKDLEIKMHIIREIQSMIQVVEGRKLDGRYKNIDRLWEEGIPLTLNKHRILSEKEIQDNFADAYEAREVARRQEIKDFFAYKGKNSIEQIKNKVLYQPYFDYDEMLIFDDNNKPISAKEYDVLSGNHKLDNYPSVSYEPTANTYSIVDPQLYIEPYEISEDEERELQENKVIDNSEKMAFYNQDRLYRNRTSRKKVDNRIRAGNSGFLEKNNLSKEANIIRIKKELYANVKKDLSRNDISGRKLNDRLIKNINDTSFKDEHGNVLSFFIWKNTPLNIEKAIKFGYEFTTFNNSLEMFLKEKENTPFRYNGMFQEFYINSVNPLVLDIDGWNTVKILEILFKNKMINEGFYEKLMSRKTVTQVNFNNLTVQLLLERIKILGYDSIVFVKESGECSVLPFEENQIIPVARNGIICNNDQITQNDIDVEYEKEICNVKFLSINEQGENKIDVLDVKNQLENVLDNTEKLVLLTQILTGANSFEHPQSEKVLVGCSGVLEKKTKDTSEAIAIFKLLKSRTNIFVADKDVAFRDVYDEVRDEYRNTIFKDNDGRLLSLFSYVGRFDHDQFGIQLSTLTGARKICDAEKEKHALLFDNNFYEYYVNMINPFFYDSKDVEITPAKLANKLFAYDKITFEEYSQVLETKGFETTTCKSPAAAYLRRVMWKHGIDGVFYRDNDGNLEIIAIYPQQLRPVSKNGDFVEQNELKKRKWYDKIDNDDNKLTDEEKILIKSQTGWSDEVVDFIRSMDEALIYINAGLVEYMDNGVKYLIRNDIDINQVNSDGSTNSENMEKSLAPYSKDGQIIELHHIGQDDNSPLAELTVSEHRKKGNNKILHKTRRGSSINRSKFDKTRSSHWKNRKKGEKI